MNNVLGLIAGTILGLAAPAAAQTAPSAAVVPGPLAPADAARLAAARPVIDQVWPLGTYARLMAGSMEQIMQTSMAGMYGLRAGDLARSAGDTTAAGGETLGETLRREDPAFEERMRRTMRVMSTEMGRIMTAVEPQVRDALAHAYARRFTVAELTELRAFFAMPTGQAYAHDSLMLMMSPEMMGVMQSFAPRMIAEMPAIMTKVEAATRDLPPPPAREPRR